VRCDLGSERIYPYREPALDRVDLLIDGDDLLIEHADVPAQRMHLGRDDVLEGPSGARDARDVFHERQALGPRSTRAGR
jgi:hypothetical protein